MKPHEQIAQLEKENQQLREQISGLTKRLEEMKQVTKEQKPSQSRVQAEAAYALLQSGPVTKEMLSKINQKYPSDAIYYVRTILKQEVKTVKTKAGSVYMLPAIFDTYMEGVRRDEELAKAAAAAKEALQPISQAQATA